MAASYPPMALQQQGTNKPSQARAERLASIADAIKMIYEHGSSSLGFQTLYTCAYYLVLHHHGNALYNLLQEEIGAQVVEMRTVVLAASDSEFLSCVLEKWESHQVAIEHVRHIVLYLDKNFDSRMNVYDLGLYLFGERMLKHSAVSERLKFLMLEIIRAERKGEQAPARMLLKNITDMMVEVGKRDVYEPCLEHHFLSVSQLYFRMEAERVLENTTVPEYLKYVFRVLDEEVDRVERCLDPSTKGRIEEIVKQEMVVNHSTQLIEKEHTGCLAMLQDWRVDDLGILYAAMKQTENVDPIVVVVKEFLLGWGLSYVTDPTNNQQPLVLIQGVLEQRAKYADLIVNAFSHMEGGKMVKDRTFDLAITKAFEEVVNKNPRVPEYLSLYVDSKLRKGRNQVWEEEMEGVFEQVVMLFRYLREKDVFEKYYKSHLAKRLLGQKSASEDLEHSFIQKLKGEYGYQFTAKLEGMFQDMRINKGTMDTYKQHLQEGETKLPCELSVHVLTTNNWPFSKTLDLRLPPEISEVSSHFTEFYMSRHSGRKLTWQYQLGTADLRHRTSTKTYELNVSTVQLVILLLFNSQSTYTFSDIQSKTNIPIPDLKRALHPLTHASKTYSTLLNKDTTSKDVEATTKISHNEDFKSKFIRIKIPQVVQKEVEEEAKDIRSKVDDERKWQLDAAIVRVMKSRKTEEHRNLVVELAKIFQGRFHPTPECIKRRLDSLIEREYIERCKDSRSRYNYLA